MNYGNVFEHRRVVLTLTLHVSHTDDYLRSTFHSIDQTSRTPPIDQAYLNILESKEYLWLLTQGIATKIKKYSVPDHATMVYNIRYDLVAYMNSQQLEMYEKQTMLDRLSGSHVFTPQMDNS